MDGDGSSSGSPRKLRFTPKAPQRRKPSTAPPPKTEEIDEERDEAEAQSLLRRFNENVARRGPKAEKKTSLQVAFGPGASSSSSSLRKFGISRHEDSGTSNSSASKGSENEKNVLSFPSPADEDRRTTYFVGALDTGKEKVKEYKEPWDYHHSYYPTTLPLRKPFSGDPEVLDEAEFGKAATDRDYDEDIMNPAKDLGLLEGSQQKKMLFIQFPNPTRIEESGGCIGKMLVYKSGTVKLKLGELLYDVNPSTNCICVQDVVAINTKEKNCCSLGELGKRVAVTPDIDALLNSPINLRSGPTVSR